MINQENIIEKTRIFMKKEKINFLIVFSTDKYLNEYVDLNENARYILTGFSGSTGDALVTPKDVFLFVDGRYHLQADEEVNKNLITVVKVGMDKSPQIALYEKIAELSDHAAKIGIISKKMGCGGFRKLLDILSEKNGNIKEFDFDPVMKFAGVKKSEKINELRDIPTEISGLSAEEKLDLIIKNNHENNIDVLVITKLEEIAYLCNLRGNEIPYSSSFKAKAVINSEKCFVFTDLRRITPEIRKKLGNRFIFDENDFLKDLENLSEPVNIGFDLNSMTLSDCRKLERFKHRLIEVKDSPIALMKSVKNIQELEHIQECFLKTDIVINRAISWLNQNLEHGVSVSEKDFSDKIKSLFFEEGAVGLSFETIAASGKNTAFIHYTKADPEKFIQPGELVLLDCGAYFKGGYATDITRTFLAKIKETSASAKQKEIYTRVLKAFLHGINYDLQESTTGFDIDKKVRDIISQDKPEGFNFSHGTGHGVGISVHESPPRLAPSEVSQTKLLTGMCFTIEPGLYCDDWGGVRIENTVVITPAPQGNELQKPPAKQSSASAFSTPASQIISLTKTKFDDNLINYDLLTEQEKIWLEKYKKQEIG